MKAGGLSKDETIFELQFALANFRANSLQPIWRLNRRTIPKYPHMASEFGAERDVEKRAMCRLEAQLVPSVREAIRKSASKMFRDWCKWNAGHETAQKEAA